MRRFGKSSYSAILIALGAVGACATGMGGRSGAVELSAAKTPAPPTYQSVRRTVWLDQGWSDSERDWFHHVSQGTDTLPLPYAWFVALERPIPSLKSPGLFSDQAYLDQFGFIPSSRSADNPAGLPVGFARTAGVDPADGRGFDQLGFTCAACHTARLDYQGTSVFVDGGPAITDVGRFRKALGYALLLTDVSLPRFLRFAARVLGPDATLAAKANLKIELKSMILAALGPSIAEPHGATTLEEGFGRLDALNRIGNEVFAAQLGDKRNYAPLSAPVAYPHIWDTAWFDWVQYNSSIEQPMVRNAGEAMGVRALVNYHGTATPRFTSTIPVDRLHEIETLLAGKTQPTAAGRFTGLRAPAWPGTILPPIDAAQASRGAALSERYCKSCHLPPANSAAFWSGPAWLPANAAGQRYLRPVVVPVSAIGTDPAQAVDMKARTVRVPLSFALTGAVRTEGDAGVYAYGPALGQMVERVVDRWYESRTPPVPQAERDRLNGYRANGIRDGLPGPDGSVPVYKARPLDGIWATAPYLHNGSVPTLYDLLSPYADRPRSFWLGNREFDPVKVGYVTTPLHGGFLLMTTDARTGRPLRGNDNGGHLFETPRDPAHPRPGTIGPTLSPAERAALVEFLKTL